MVLSDISTGGSKIDRIIRQVSSMSSEIFKSNKVYLSVNGHKLFLDEEHQIILLQEYEKNLMDLDTKSKAIAGIEDSVGEKTNPSALDQLLHASSLPSIRGIVGLPDMHQGYHFPVGTAIAVDLDSENAWISPEGVGFDINCGVRCIKSNLEYDRDTHSIKVHGTSAKYSGNIFENIADELNKRISSGTKASSISISIKDLNDILDNGLKAKIFGELDTLPAFNGDGKYINCTPSNRIESSGSLPGNNKLISQKAKGRGINLLGTLGSGNHYLEIQYVDEVFDYDIALEYGLEINQIVIFIHTGSRGLGHEVCSSFISQSRGAYIQNLKNNDEYGHNNGPLPENSTERPHSNPFYNSAIPFNSKDGQRYFSAMNSAANYAFANRELIFWLSSYSIKSCIPASKFETLYDCCHNIAKIEKIKGSTLLVHRKGASRAIPSQELANHSVDSDSNCGFTHQPIPVGGSMATASYILASNSTEKTFYSTCHGSGRLIPRSKAKDHFTYECIEEEMNSRKIVFRSQSRKGIVEEAGGCYKDIDKVVDHSEISGLTKKVVKLRPLIVIKG